MRVIIIDSQSEVARKLDIPLPSSVVSFAR